MTNSSLFVLLSFLFFCSNLFVSVFSQSEPSAAVLLQFSNQYGGTYSLQVNGNSVSAFNNLVFGQASSYVDVSPYNTNTDNTLVFTLTLWTEGEEVSSDQVQLSTQMASSYYISQSEENTLLVSVVPQDSNAPAEFYSTWRIAELASISANYTVSFDGNVVISSLNNSAFTEYYSIVCGAHLWQIMSGGQVVATLNTTLDAGTVNTLVFQGGNTTADPFTLVQYQDTEYYYPNFTVRLVNAVQGSNVTVFLQELPYNQENTTLWTGIGYGTVTSYMNVSLNNYYTAYFVEDGTTITATTTFAGGRSSQMSLVYYGDLTSTTSNTKVNATSFEDASEGVMYTQLSVRVAQLSPSPQVVTVLEYINQVPIVTIDYGETSDYRLVDTVPFNLTLQNFQGISFFDQEMSNATFLNSYTLWVMGNYTEGLDYVWSTDFVGSSNVSTANFDNNDDDGSSSSSSSGWNEGDTGAVIVGIIGGVLILAILILQSKKWAAENAEFSPLHSENL